MKNRACRRATVAVLAACIASVTVLAPAVDAYTGSAESANARFVVATHRQLLGHDPHDEALDRHLSLVAAGGDVSRELVARELLFSPEASAREVDRAYRGILHRSAEPEGKIYWTAHLQDHDVLDLRVLLLSSDEYFNRSGGTNRDWIRKLYTDILGRRPEAAGLRYWVDEANRGTERALIVAGFYLGWESLGNRTDEYHRLVLKRPAGMAERTAGALLIATDGERALHARLWASDEMFEQFFDAAWSPR